MNAFSSDLAQRIKSLRQQQDLSLEALAQKSGVSRATLSRLENSEVSPTADVLNKLCAVYGITLSRLMAMVEEQFTPLVAAQAQEIWQDKSVGFSRRLVSPPATGLKGEVLACEIQSNQTIAYDQSPMPGLEHHLVLQEGVLTITIHDQIFQLKVGDCLRYQLNGPSIFQTSAEQGAKYFLFMV